MKLTGNLKTQVDNAPTKEEKRDAIKKVMLLSDDELDQVAGGFDGDEGAIYDAWVSRCSSCLFFNTDRCKFCHDSPDFCLF